MRNSFLTLFLVLLSLTRSADAVIVNSNGKPLPEVARIFKIFEKKLSSAKSLSKKRLAQILKAPQTASAEELTSLSQEKFLRPREAERLDPASIQHYRNLLKGISSEKRRQVKENFRKLGDINPVFPTRKEFDYILINGSTVPTMRARIAFLSDAIKQGKLKMKPETQIVFLDGERKLFKTESPDVLVNPSPYPIRPGWKAPAQTQTQTVAQLPTDERDAAVLVWDQLDLTEELRQKTPVFVHAEKKPGAERAETEDCVMKWSQKFAPKPGTALVVSSNPFAYYQLLVTEVLLAKSGLGQMTLDVLGSPNAFNQPEEVELGILLDNLARTFYYYAKKQK